jgi:hypothetical protein
MSFKVTKTTVNAPSRKLNVTWNPSELKPLEITEKGSEYLITNALKRWMLQQHGTRVAVYTRDFEAMTAWCQDNIKQHFDWCEDEVLMTKERLQSDTLFAKEGKMSQEYMETLFVNSIARQVNREAAESEGLPFAHAHFWFEDANEAMMFKLTWGGC